MCIRDSFSYFSIVSHPYFPILVNVFQSNVRTIQIDRAECRQDLHFPFVIEFDTVKGVVAMKPDTALRIFHDTGSR